MLAIIGATGKLGSATLSALLAQSLLPVSQILCTTSTSPGTPKWTSLQSQGVQVRHATFDDPPSIQRALSGCTRLFLVSSPRIARDFGSATDGAGREGDHYAAIDAALAAGVAHIYYTSLAFAVPSAANVMTAHVRTEAYLARARREKNVRVTVIREGLYSESWPLYFGHWDVGGRDRRGEVLVAGDGGVAWTAIADLGLANALVLAAPPEQYAGKTFYLSNRRNTRTLEQVADYVAGATGRKVELRGVPREEHERFYIDERGMDAAMVKWWAATYDALSDGECDIEDATFEQLLESEEITPKQVEETVQEMLKRP